MTVILCSPQPASIIKAALLALVHGDLPCLKGEEAGLGLFARTPGHDADRTALPGLLTALRGARGLDAAWLRGDPGDTLRRLVAANLRYRSADRAAVAFAAVEEAILRGHAYCFSGIGDISRAFVGRYQAVAREAHKMMGFVRFHPAPDDTLVARPKLFHDTADLILQKFVPRYPGCRLVFLLPDRALVLHEGVFSAAPPEDYARYADDDPFTAVWERYYRSQYIESRKNIGLAQRCLPKKYWDWLAEGRILGEEARN